MLMHLGFAGLGPSGGLDLATFAAQMPSGRAHVSMAIMCRSQMHPL